MIPNDGDCFKCGKPGHWVDHCELNKPAADRKEHEGRIALFVDRWVNGKLLTHQKRRLIEQENAMWNSAKPTGAKEK